MTDFRHILFPVDFSERCRAVTPFVRGMAQTFDSKITLMHVLQLPQGLYAGLDPYCPIVLDVDAMRGDALEMLSRIFEDRAERVHLVVAVGDPAIEVANFVTAQGVDLVMMPTHGHGRFRSLLLGSVTAKALHDLTCPVWTAAHAEEAVAAQTPCHSTLCAVDLTPGSFDLLQQSLGVASRFGAKLRIVHAVPAADPADPRFSAAFDADFSNFLLRTARHEIAKLQQKAGTNLEVCLAAGPVARVIHDAALHHDADLVMIGRGRMQAVLGRLRTNTYGIIRESPCPVLSF